MIAGNLYRPFASYTNTISKAIERICTCALIHPFIGKGESVFFQIMLISCERNPHLLVDKTMYQVTVSTFEAISFCDCMYIYIYVCILQIHFDLMKSLIKISIHSFCVVR